jgi:hypothetical protein
LPFTCLRGSSGTSALAGRLSLSAHHYENHSPYARSRRRSGSGSLFAQRGCSQR